MAKDQIASLILCCWRAARLHSDEAAATPHWRDVGIKLLPLMKRLLFRDFISMAAISALISRTLQGRNYTG